MTGIIEVDGKDAEYVRVMFEILNLRMDNKRLRAELTAKNDAIYRLEADAELVSRENAGMRVELRELRAELARVKPDWASAPEWAVYRTQERNGKYRYWIKRPSVSEYWERWIDGTSGRRNDIAYKNWRDTLECRPEDT